MRLLELGLLRFGGFTDARLDLSAPGLQLIHGRNEAGKSTALRAITALFYGVPHSSPDTYLHDELLLSGRVRAADGSELSFLRRKGRKNTLLSPGGEPLEEHAVARLLGGVSESMFRTELGLDHERLREGGEQLARGGGDVGQSLFDAGIGGGSVKRLLDELCAEADGLFNPRAHARKPVINVALREYAEAMKRVRTESTQPQAWTQQKQELEAARSELLELEQRRAELRGKLAAAQELVAVLPIIGKRDEAEKRLTPVARAPLLPEDAAERRLLALRELDSAEREARYNQAELEKSAAELAGLVVSDELLALDDASIDALQERLGEYRRDRTDLGRQQSKLAASRALVSRRLAALGRSLDSDARALIPRRAEVARVKALTVERARLETELGQARKREAEQRVVVSKLEEERALVPRQLAEAGAPAELIDRVLPSQESVEAFARRQQMLDRARDKLGDRRQALDNDAATTRAQLAEVALAGEVPTEAELCRVREARDAAFVPLGEALGSGARVDRAVVESFERLARRADDLADRLRREAKRVERFVSLEDRRARCAEALEALDAERASLDAEQQRLDSEWRALWVETGVLPRSPDEMRALVARWLTARERRRELDVALASARAALAGETSAREETERALGAWGERWAEAVRHLGLGAEASPSEADEVQVALSELTADLDTCDALEHRIAGMEQTCEAFERDVTTLARRFLPELADRVAKEPDQVATRIIQQHRANRESARKKADLEARRARALERAMELEARSEAAQSELSMLLAAAGVSDPALLPEAEAAATVRRQAEREIAELDRDLAEVCGTASLDEVRERALGVSLHEARRGLVELEDALVELDAARDAARDRVLGAESGLARFDDRQSAADAQVEAEAILAKLRGAAERWARVRTAWLILHDEVERYRATHQAPLLARTNQLFPRLTLGNYSELRVDHDADPPVLCAVAKDGSRVPIQSLSDGARDQLYLALRLASLEHYAGANEALPLCLDDVLINFDDERSRAALEVLAETASRIQVLLFTHHEHMVSAAVAALPASALTVHELRRGEPPRQRSHVELSG